jgi:hypothetical protein
MRVPIARGAARWIVAVVLSVPAGDARGDDSLDFGPPYLSTGNFLRPYGLAVDNAHGRLLVADTANHRFKWTAAAGLGGSHAYTEFGFVASRDAPDALTDPQGIAADAAGNVYVANTLSGDVKWYAWNGGSYQTAALLCPANAHTVDGLDIQMPRDIAVGPDGAIYLLDSGNHRILKAEGPSDPDWSVFLSDASWSNPYGLTVDAAGAIFLADTGNHRVLKIQNGATVATWGHFGIGSGEFRYPRDVAVDSSGRVFVADTYNHRIALLAADGSPLINLGHAPSIGTLEKVVVDGDGRLFAVDSDNNTVIAFLGAGVAAPFDAFVRDYVGDTGAEPSDDQYLLGSPDILVRHEPDVDLAAAAVSGLEGYAFQQPRYEQLNYVYVAVRNQGTQPATDNFAQVYWFDPGSAGKFPANWKTSGFYSAYSDASHNMPENTLSVPSVAANGVMVAGPLIWRPPSPESAFAGDGGFRLGVRVTNPYDYPPVGDSTTMARDSNNVAQRNVVVTRGPFPAGAQNTLVVRVHFPDVASLTDATTVETRANELAAWILETSWGEANVNVLQRGPVMLPHNKSHYADPSNTLLVELAQDVLDQLLATEPTLLDGTGPGNEIGRLVLVTNDLSDQRDWATTGSWPYSVGSATRYLTVSVQGGNNPAPLFAHGLSHQLNMVDLYAHENVTFSRPYADGWDNMATPMKGAHPLVWSKELATWVTAHDAKIVFVARPAPGTTWNNGGVPIPLHYQETAAAGQVVGVAFGLTNGVTSFTDETAFYYVEARKNSGTGAGADAILPQTGVIMYYANKLIPQGQGPVILRDHVPGGSLNDAAIPLWASEAPSGTGIKVTVQAGTSGADYNLAVQYNPPATDYDVYMDPGDPPWESPDIWVDNKQDGYDEENNRTPKDRGNLGIAGEKNRVYARVSNRGPADAFDVEVAFFFSEPYHTVDGEDAFDEFKSVFLDKVESGKDETAYVTWTPETGVDPHTCARVELRRLFDDTNAANDEAQRNLEIDHSVHGSPYTPVEFPFMVRNEESKARLVYFRVEGVPAGWTWSVAPSKALVAPGAMASATLKLQPPPDAADCTSHKLYVTGWIPRGDTIVRLGGTTVDVQLQQKTTVRVSAQLEACRPEDLRPSSEEQEPTKEEASGSVRATPAVRVTRMPTVEGFDLPAATPENRGLLEALQRELPPLAEEPAALAAGVAAGRTGRRDPKACARIRASGCTDPKRPHEEVVLRYEAPGGEPVFHTVQTDANGCFDDFAVTVEGGDWTVAAEFPGNACEGPAHAEVGVKVPLPEGGRPEGPIPDPEQRLCVTGVSRDLSGRLVPGSRGRVGCERGTTAEDQALHLELRPSGAAGEDDGLLTGRLDVSDLRQIVRPADKGAGLHYGRFRFTSDGMEAVGTIAGLTSLGTHWPEVSACAEPRRVPEHRELSLMGTVVRGKQAGARIRAVLALDLGAGAAGQTSASVKGTMEGVVEKSCSLSAPVVQRRVDQALAQASRPWTPPCNGRIPCLAGIAKKGKGRLILDQTGRDQCREGACPVLKTWSRMEVSLAGEPGFEGAQPFLGDGVLRLARFVQVLRQSGEGRGEHGGRFAYRTRDGVWVRGEMYGITRAGTHRRPLARACEQPREKDHSEAGWWAWSSTGRTRARWWRPATCCASRARRGADRTSRSASRGGA